MTTVKHVSRVRVDDTHMQVSVNGVLEERPISHRRYHNGYTDLACPALRHGETCHWTAGSRVPEILQG